MTTKVLSLGEAAGRVSDGCRLAIGGFAVYQHPMAFVRELVRRGRRDLTVVGAVNGNDVDLLAGAGCLRRVESSYVGLEKYGGWLRASGGASSAASSRWWTTRSTS